MESDSEVTSTDGTACVNARGLSSFSSFGSTVVGQVADYKGLDSANFTLELSQLSPGTSFSFSIPSLNSTASFLTSVPRVSVSRPRSLPPSLSGASACFDILLD